MERLSIDEIIKHCKRKVARYEQLNGIETLENADISNNFIREYWEHRQVGKWLQELKEYRQLAEQGLLLKLPCKVGSTVYLISSRYTKCSKYGEEFEEYNCQGCEEECDSRKEYFIHTNYSVSLEWIVRNISNFGKTVFLTQAEAKEALKGMEGDNEVD